MSIELVRKLPYYHPYRWDGSLFGGPKLWQPDEVATELWLDAADTDTITESSGLVSQWDDKSGNENDVSAADSYRPTYASGGWDGVLPSIYFDGNDRELWLEEFSGTSAADWVVFAVLDIGTAAKTRKVVLYGYPTLCNYFAKLSATLGLGLYDGDEFVG